MSSKNVVVTVGDEHLPAIRKVATELQARGMKVDSVLEATGHITGTYSKSPSVLRGVNGVISVEEAPQIQLPPPDSDVQ